MKSTETDEIRFPTNLCSTSVFLPLLLPPQKKAQTKKNVTKQRKTPKSPAHPCLRGVGGD